MEDTENKKRILITGASGFVGGHLVEAALNKGYEVWAGVRASSDRSVLDALNRGYGIWADPREAGSGKRLHKDDRIRFIDLPYTDEAALIRQLEAFNAEHGGWHYIIHNAGVTKSLHKETFFEVNAENTRRFLHALTVSGCKPDRFVLMSSLSTFGSSVDRKPFQPIRPDDEQEPDTVYGQSKQLAEQYLRSQTAIPYVILRPTGVFGPCDKDYLMQVQSVRSGFDFTIGYSRQWLTFIYVEDLAAVAMLALENEKAAGQAYFVADGGVCTDKDFGRMIQQLTCRKWALHLSIPVWVAYIACQCAELVGTWKKKPMTLNSDKFHLLKQRKWICDVEPMQCELGFKAPYPFYQRLQQTIAWYTANGWL